MQSLGDGETLDEDASSEALDVDAQPGDIAQRTVPPGEGNPRDANAPAPFREPPDTNPEVPERESDAISAPARSHRILPPIADWSLVADLDPALDHLIEIAPDGRVHPWPLPRPYYSIGRGRAKIAVDDGRVARRHVSLARIGGDWLAINHTRRRSMRVNGWKLRQRTLQAGDVLRIGETDFVFSPKRENDRSDLAGVQESRATLESLDEPDGEGAELTVSGEGVPAAVSRGRTLLIGSHPDCSVQLAGDGIVPFHAFISWLPSGPVLFALGGEVSVGGTLVRKSALPNGGSPAVGNRTLRVTVTGDAVQPAQARQRGMRRQERSLQLSVFYGPCCGSRLEVLPAQPASIGRSREADLSLPAEKRLADCQLQVVLNASVPEEPPQLQLEVRDTRVPTLVNRKAVNGTGTARPGDVIQFGSGERVLPTAILVHYPSSSASWPAETDPA